MDDITPPTYKSTIFDRRFWSALVIGILLLIIGMFFIRSSIFHSFLSSNLKIDIMSSRNYDLFLVYISFFSGLIVSFILRTNVLKRSVFISLAYTIIFMALFLFFGGNSLFLLFVLILPLFSAALIVSLIEKTKSKTTKIGLTFFVIIFCTLLTFILLEKRYYNPSISDEIPYSHVSEELMVTFNAGVSIEEAKEIAKKYDAKFTSSREWDLNSSNFVIFIFDGKSDKELIELVQLIKTEESVSFALPNATVSDNT